MTPGMLGMWRKVIGALLCLASCLVAAEPDQRLVYKEVGETKLELHLFEPPHWKVGQKNAAIVFFFGGGWKGGRISQFYPQADYLAQRGMVALTADYRVSSRHRTSPRECVEDGKAAIRWIRENAKALGVDPSRVVAGGGSAGGHVAAATGTILGFEGGEEELSVSSRPQALVLFNPVFDNGPTGYGYTRVKDYWWRISPLHNLSPQSPPTIVFLGTEDHLVPVATAKRYQSLMGKHQVLCELHLYEGQKHGFFNAKNAKYFRETTREMERFLASLGFLKVESEVDSSE